MVDNLKIAFIIISLIISIVFKYTSIMHHPYAYIFYGAGAAAIFEEFGRLIGFKTILNTPAYLFLLSGFERLFAFTLQIALSILVFYSIKSGRYKFFLYALLLHFSTDIFAALYQVKVIKNLFAVETILFAIAVFSFLLIIKSKKMFERTAQII
ncbi:MAG: YhfC family glutamic-type intramembrane protease [Thermoanaerobacteraceae bacterium]|nr:YhfC family glutamic-type intramembrane protease [Thermoanaerobacteraceae bacterium]